MAVRSSNIVAARGTAPEVRFSVSFMLTIP